MNAGSSDRAAELAAVPSATNSAIAMRDGRAEEGDARVVVSRVMACSPQASMDLKLHRSG
jgi:hypothetical protein